MIRRLLEGGRASLVGALLMVLANATTHMLMLPPFLAVDEGRHLGYAVAIVEGKIPHVLEPIDPAKIGTRDIVGSNLQAAAAHPPLYHAIVGLPFQKAVAAGRVALGVRFARTVSIVFGLISLVMAWRVLRALLPRRDDLVALALGATACLPTFTFATSVAYNDSLAMLAVTGALASFCTAAATGFRRALYVECIFWACVAGLTRLTALLAISPLAVGWWLLLARGAEGPALKRHLRGALGAAGLGAAVLATSGWFYLRNLSIYGDVTAASALFQRLSRSPHGYFNAFVLRPGTLYEQHWTRIVGGVRLPASSERYAHALMSLAALGGIVLCLRLVRRRPLPSLGRPLRLPWAAVAASAAIILFLTLMFHARGGDLTPRYILPVVWLQMLILMVPMTWPRGPSLAVGVIFSMALMHFLVMEAYAAEQIGEVLLRPDNPRRKGIDFAIAIGIRKSGVPLPEVWFVGALALFTTGLVVLLGAFNRAYRSTLAPITQPAVVEPAVSEPAA